jgi:glutamate 5-kinase
MGSKLEAAKMATAFGTKVHILSSQNPLDVIGSLAGQQHGTTFLPSSNPVEARKAWIAYAVPPQGKLLIDRGALEALCKGKSLLPVGILRVSGSFRRGNAVEVFFEDHHQKRLVARGICKYSSGEIAHIMGHMSSEIEDLLGYSYGNSVIHRDDMALLSSND